MSKLFITPRHGYLGKTMDKLRKEDYEVALIGWGYPPIYVEADKSKLQDIQDIVEEIDEKAEFRPYRDDLIEPHELISILERFDMADIIKLCVKLDITYHTLPGYVNSDLKRLVGELVGKFRNDNKLPELVKATYEMKPNLF
ncbi:MAG: hypothetical protein GWN30_07335 [Gammaproteobacteria bacterium]|nr:hypothetical protein [Gammaproteobacteria bacterium]NIX02653.1 hypothetical protein [Phycisphaerae bacterium]